MNKIINHKVLSASNIEYISIHVCDNIEDGWQPLGGISVVMDNKGSFFYQAMVMYENFESTTQFATPT